MGKKENQEKTDKRELILEAAASVFSEKGYHNATVEEIAKRAEIGKGTIYQYFSSKQDILVEMMDRKFGKYTDSIQNSILENDTAQNNMQRVINAHFVELADIHQFAAGFFQTGGSPEHCGSAASKVVEENRKKFVGAIEKLIQLGQEKGELCAGDAGLMAAAMIGALMGISGWAIEHQSLLHSEPEQEAFTSSIAKVMIAGLENNTTR